MGRWVVLVAVVGMALAADQSRLRAEDTPSGARGYLEQFHCYLDPPDCADPAARTCVEACDVAFDSCLAGNGEAGRSGRCRAEVVRCKATCAKQSPPPSDAATARRTPLACRDTCRTRYKECLGANGKRSSRCETAELRCRQACPSEVVAALSQDGSAPESAVALAATAPLDTRADRNSTATSIAPTGDGMPAGVSQAGAPAEDGFLHRVRCFVSPACAGVSAAATTGCVDTCESQYEACRKRASSRDDNECSVAIMRCRQRCRDEAPK